MTAAHKSAYKGVSFDSAKGKWQAYARIEGAKVTFGNHATDVEAAIARNEGLVVRLGAEAAAPFLNLIDPDDAPVERDPLATGDFYEGMAAFEARQANNAATVAPAAADDEDLRPAPLPDALGVEALGELEGIGIANLHDSVKHADERLFKLRHMTPRRVDLLRAAEVAAGLRDAQVAEREATPDDRQVAVDPDDRAIAEDDDGYLLPPMTDDERADFERLKTEARDSAVKLWQALAQISDGKLYRETYTTFEAFTQAEFGHGRQWAYQLIDAAKVAGSLATVGVTPQNERQARDLKKAAKMIDGMDDEKRLIVAKFVEAATGSDRPLTVQVKAAAEVVRQIDLTGAVDDPDRPGEMLTLSELSPERRSAVVLANVTAQTSETLRRQDQHIADKAKTDKTLKGTGTGGSGAQVEGSSWSDWLMNYAAQGLAFEHDVRITIAKDASGNPTAVAQVIDRTTGAVIAEGEPNTRYVKGTVMSLIERLKYGGDVKG